MRPGNGFMRMTRALFAFGSGEIFRSIYLPFFEAEHNTFP